MEANNTFIYKIDKIEGVDVNELSDALKAINEEFLFFTHNEEKLLIKEIRKGSGIFEFVTSTIIPTIALLNSTATILDFLNHIKTITNALLAQSQKPLNTLEMTKESCDNVSKIYAPVVNGDNNVIQFITTENSYATIKKHQYPELKNAADEFAKKEKQEELQEAECHRKVFFKWIQTRFQNSNTGDIGIIENISKGKKKIIFLDDDSDTKKEMTTSSKYADWQDKIYVVDVEVMKIGGKIVAYKILKNYPNDSIYQMNLFED